MGLLSDDLDQVTRLKDLLVNSLRSAPNTIGGLVSNYAGNVQQRAQTLAGLLRGQEPTPQQKSLFNIPDVTTPQGALDMAQNAPMGLLGHIAYHGSPHTFDKFDLSKIGTGEGAQAYGHGMYLAENPKVAQSYKETLSDNKVKINGQPINNALPDQLAAAVLVQSKGNKNAALQFLQSNLQYAKGDSVTKLNNAIDYLKSGQELPVAETSGALYKTDIPDTHLDKMLDWDKPLSEQSQHVQDALQKFGIGSTKSPNLMNDTELLGALGQFTQTLGSGEKTGAGLYKELIGHYGDDAAVSNAMRQAGIPGIKYLDGSSRAGGEGTHNFVIFNPDDIRILERNGQPTGQVPWGF